MTNFVLDLDPEFSPIQYRVPLTYKTLVFNGGEVHVRLEDMESCNDGSLVITARLNHSEDIMRLLLATDAARYLGFEHISVLIPYLPYARQDRVCNKGESLSLRVMAGLLNDQDYDRVTILDPHSDVATALIDRVHVIGQAPTFVNRVMDLEKGGYRKGMDSAILISPDAGAAKKTQAIAEHFKDNNIWLRGTSKYVAVVRADKVRDVKDGKILATSVYDTDEDVESETCYIFDDICDGGRTFIELAKVLKCMGAREVILAVTHGIFSKGVDVVLEYVDRIYTTDSVRNWKDNKDTLRVIPVGDLL
jgi:ribose-phosphate pyrophosphokinase